MPDSAVFYDESAFRCNTFPAFFKKPLHLKLSKSWQNPYNSRIFAYSASPI